jgi:hypothetical protein
MIQVSLVERNFSRLERIAVTGVPERISAPPERGLRGRTMKNSLKTLAIGVLAVALFGTTALSAQVETGQLAGTVTDPLGAVIVGATVTVRNNRISPRCK